MVQLLCSSRGHRKYMNQRSRRNCPPCCARPFACKALATPTPILRLHDDLLTYPPPVISIQSLVTSTDSPVASTQSPVISTLSPVISTKGRNLVPHNTAAMSDAVHCRPASAMKSPYRRPDFSLCSKRQSIGLLMICPLSS